jgi:ABC-type amino acid transport substrate-binding protein
MRNGDILNGKVLTVTTNILVLQDDNIGTLTLERAKVSNVTFGVVMQKAVIPITSVTNTLSMPQSAESQTNSLSDLQGMFRGIRDQSNLVQQVEAQVLGSSASPEAVNKFNELLDGLSTGKIDMNDLRAQAQSAANQLQEYKKQMGPDAGEEVDGYLAVLNNFLQETAQPNSATNSPTP